MNFATFDSFVSYGLGLVNLVDLIRVYCLVSIAAICTARLVPATRKRLLSYGARGVSSISTKSRTNNLSKVLDLIATFDVPHSWFYHFYIHSLSYSIFWTVEIIARGRLLRFVDAMVPRQHDTSAAEGSLFCIILMSSHSARRLVECCAFSHSSKSRMWIGHYVFGLSFYCIVNLATWVKSVPSLLAQDVLHLNWVDFFAQPRTVVGFLLFGGASIVQHVAHSHLATLPKYSVPSHWLFKRLIAPHYTAECILYLGLSIVAAPDEHVANDLLLWIALLSAVNLGITADDTKKWLLQKFKEQRSEIQGRYRLIPWIW